MKILLVIAVSVSLWAAYLAQDPIDNEIEIKDEKFYDTWDAPEEMKKQFTYYLSGYDDEGRPLWILEFGKWDLRKIVEEGPEKMKEFDMYADQFFWRVQKSVRESINPEDGEPPTGWVCISDLADYKIRQLSSPPTVVYLLHLARKFEITTRNMDYGFFINLNYVAELLIRILRPALGTTLDRVEIIGTNRERWLLGILQKLPKSILPEWYGGFKNYTPLAVYG